MRTRRFAAGRRGITLVELLVVSAIVVALLGLVAAIGPRLGERQRASRGASMVQSWLNLAKQRALRDQRPRGIRLPALMNAAPEASYVTELQFIEIPEPFTGGQLVIPAVPNGPYNQVLLVGVELPGVDRDGIRLGAAVQIGDVLDLTPQYEPRRIVGIQMQRGGAGATPSYTIALDQPLVAPPPPGPPMPTEIYRIHRQARPIPGEPILALPKDIGIDISRQATPPGQPPSWYRMFPPLANTGVPGPFDILFAPSGRVIGHASLLGSRISLWIRDVSTNVPSNQMPPGENSLITVYTRSGQIASHPVDDTQDASSGAYMRLQPGATWNPFSFTQDNQ